MYDMSETRFILYCKMCISSIIRHFIIIVSSIYCCSLFSILLTGSSNINSLSVCHTLQNICPYTNINVDIQPNAIPTINMIVVIIYPNDGPNANHKINKHIDITAKLYIDNAR
jgi:hypothetical protein